MVIWLSAIWGQATPNISRRQVVMLWLRQISYANQEVIWQEAYLGYSHYYLAEGTKLPSTSSKELSKYGATIRLPNQSDNI